MLRDRPKSHGEHWPRGFPRRPQRQPRTNDLYLRYLALRSDRTLDKTGSARSQTRPICAAREELTAVRHRPKDMSCYRVPYSARPIGRVGGPKYSRGGGHECSRRHSRWKLRCVSGLPVLQGCCAPLATSLQRGDPGSQDGMYGSRYINPLDSVAWTTVAECGPARRSADAQS